MLVGGRLQVGHPRMEQPGVGVAPVHGVGEVAEEHASGRGQQLFAFWPEIVGFSMPFRRFEAILFGDGRKGNQKEAYFWGVLFSWFISKWLWVVSGMSLWNTIP